MLCAMLLLYYYDTLLTIRREYGNFYGTVTYGTVQGTKPGVLVPGTSTVATTPNYSYLL